VYDGRGTSVEVAHGVAEGEEASEHVGLSPAGAYLFDEVKEGSRLAEGEEEEDFALISRRARALLRGEELDAVRVLGAVLLEQPHDVGLLLGLAEPILWRQCPFECKTLTCCSVLCTFRKASQS